MNLLANKAGRGVAVFGFYFAEGVPIGFIWWAMPTLMRQQNVPLDTIGSFTTLLTLPWVFKFLWAPLIDIVRTPRFGFVKWIGISQSLMCLSLLPLLFIPLKENISVWGVCLFLHSMFAATQDVAVDALVINLSVSQEKGTLNGFMQAGMLLGRSLFGGVVLIFTAHIGINMIAALMILAILSTMTLLLFIKEPVAGSDHESSFTHFKQKLVSAFAAKNTWYCLGFALTAAAAFETAGAFAGPFFTDRGLSEKTIGYFFALPVVVAMLIGGFIGGFLSDRMPRKNAVGIYLTGIILFVSAISLTGYGKAAPPPSLLLILYGCMYLFTGMFTAASYALFMDATDPKLGATQFSSFMAATNGCEAWVVYSSGLIAVSNGYHSAFLVMALVSLGSFIFLSRIKN